MTAGKDIRRVGLEVQDPWQAIEACYLRDWSDGLPVVPPTDNLVDAMLACGPWAEDEVLLYEPVRGISVTALHAAINAVMAGCRPEYFAVWWRFCRPWLIPLSGSTVRPPPLAGRRSW